MSIERIRAALAAGPTPGPWSVETVPTSCGVCHKVGPFPGRRPGDPPRHACLYADYPSQGNPADDELEANAAFIAACNPAAIRALLAEHDALKAENERLRDAGVGYSQQTVDALSSERDRLRAALTAAMEVVQRERTRIAYNAKGAPPAIEIGYADILHRLDAVIAQADAALWREG